MADEAKKDKDDYKYRQGPNSVYDQEKDSSPITRPGYIKPVEGQGESDGKKTGKLGVAGSKNDPNLQDKEAAGGVGNQGSVGDKESKLNKGFTGGAAPEALKGALAKASPVYAAYNTFFGSRRKKGVGISIGFLVALGIFVFSFLQGPLQLVHFAELLKNFHLRDNEDFGDNRASKVLLYSLLAKGAERGRMGITMNYVTDIFETDLRDKAGVRPVYTERRGRHVGFALDGITQENAGNKAFDRLADTDLGRALLDAGAELKTVEEASAKGQNIKGGGNRDLDPKSLIIVVEDPDSIGFSQERAIIRAILKDAGYGKLAATAGARLLQKRGEVSFHNFSKVGDKIADKYDAKKRTKKKEKIKAQLAKEAEKGVTPKDAIRAGPSDNGDDEPTVSTDDQEASDETQKEIDKAKKEFAGKKTLKSIKTAAGKAAGPAVAVGILCTVKDAGKQVEEYRYLNNILPMMRMFMQIVSGGSQVKSGDDIDQDSAAALADTFYNEDDGTSLVESKPFQAAMNKPQTGVDAPREAKIASIEDRGTVFEVVDRIPLLGSACAAGNFISGLPGLKQAGDLTAKVASEISSAVTGSSVEEFLGEAIAALSGKSVNTLAEGGEKSALAMIGGQFTSINDAGSSGGVENTPAQNGQIRMEGDIADAESRKYESFASRYLDVYDNDSLVGFAVLNTPKSFSQLASSFSLNSLSRSLSSIFTKNVFAAEVSTANKYNYGIEDFGFTSAEQKDDRFANPIENATIIEDEKNAGAELERLNNEYSECFKIKITNDDSGVHLEHVDDGKFNPLKIPGKCKRVDSDKNDIEDREDYLRYRFYIADSKVAVSLACVKGKEDDPVTVKACEELGFENFSEQKDSSEGSGGTIVEVAEREFSKNGNKVLETCGENCGPEVQKYTGGPSGPRAPWCAWFVSWVYRESGNEFNGPPAGADGNIPSVVNLVVWFKDHGIHFTPDSGQHKPEPGDVIMYGGSQHTGIVIKVNGDNIETIEGNTSSDNNFEANGGTVGKKNFNYKTYSSRSIEFGRLK